MTPFVIRHVRDEELSLPQWACTYGVLMQCCLALYSMAKFFLYKLFLVQVLFVKNLHHKVSQIDLFALFGQFQGDGEDPVLIRLMKGKMKGQAFIEFHGEFFLEGGSLCQCTLSMQSEVSKYIRISKTCKYLCLPGSTLIHSSFLC